MKYLLGKNWMTTLIGLLGAVYFSIEPLLDGGSYDWHVIVKAGLSAAFGYAAKSVNVTGVGSEAKTINELKNEEKE